MSPDEMAPALIARIAAGTPETATLSARLRTETRPQHDRIEANARFARLMAPDLTMPEYRALLMRLFGHHDAAEAALAAAAAHLPAALDLGRRLRRTAALARDLRALGLDAAGIAALPRCPMGGAFDAASAWGTLYVLEGSSLGGQVIARHLAAILGIGPESGAAGMVPQGDQTGLLWREFRAAMDAAAASGAIDAGAVVAAAQTAFTRLDDWMAAAG